jgi:hypothetical protein
MEEGMKNIRRVGRGILLKAHVIGRSRTVLAEEEGVERKS